MANDDTADGNEILDITAGGSAVQEVTVDGSVAWTAETPPTVSISDATATSSTSVNVECTVNSMGTYSTIYYFPVYRKSWLTTWNSDDGSTTVSNTGTYQDEITGLQPDTSYEFRGEFYETDSRSGNLLAATDYVSLYTPAAAIQSYESGSLSGYSGDTSYYNVTSSWSQDGTYALEDPSGDGSGEHIIVNTSITGPSWGNNYRWYFRPMAGSGGSSQLNWRPVIRVDDVDNWLGFGFLISGNMILRTIENVNGTINVIKYTTNVSSISAGEVCYIDFDMNPDGSTLTYEVFNSSGTSIASDQSTVSNNYGNGIGMANRNGTGQSLYDDYLINRENL